MNDDVLAPILEALDNAISNRARGEEMRIEGDRLVEDSDRQIAVLQETVSKLKGSVEKSSPAPSMREIISWKVPGEIFTIDGLHAELAKAGNEVARTSLQSMVSRMKADGKLESPRRGEYAIPPEPEPEEAVPVPNYRQVAASANQLLDAAAAAAFPRDEA